MWFYWKLKGHTPEAFDKKHSKHTTVISASSALIVKESWEITKHLNIEKGT